MGKSVEGQIFDILWGHHHYIIDKCYFNPNKAMFYVQKILNIRLNFLSFFIPKIPFLFSIFAIAVCAFCDCGNYILKRRYWRSVFVFLKLPHSELRTKTAAEECHGSDLCIPPCAEGILCPHAHYAVVSYLQSWMLLCAVFRKGCGRPQE